MTITNMHIIMHNHAIYVKQMKRIYIRTHYKFNLPPVDGFNVFLVDKVVSVKKKKKNIGSVISASVHNFKLYLKIRLSSWHIILIHVCTIKKLILQRRQRKNKFISTALSSTRTCSMNNNTTCTHISISVTCSLQTFQATCTVLKPTSHKQAKCVNTRKDNYTSSLTFMYCFKKSSTEMT